MKSLYGFFAVILISIQTFSQGSTCNTAIPLIIDGVCRTYPFTNTQVASSLNCAGGTGNIFAPLYSGNGRVIFFKFTTGAGQPVPCFSTEISVDGTASVECILSYADCASPWGPYYETVCFNDGNGYWAPNDRNTYGDGDLDPNTTYILRFRAQEGFNGNITICANYNDPDNVSCPRATTLTTAPTLYENSCHKGDTIPAGDLCAQSLENTAWYSYTIQGSTEDLLNVSAINCDNYTSNDHGYQLGIFTGDCGNLQSYGPCFKDFGGSLQFPLDGLAVGTTVYIAIDGNASSNCRYLIWVGGAVILPAKWGYFTGKAMSNGNQLRWSTQEEINTSHFEIERSEDAGVFYKIATIRAAGTTPQLKEYTYFDNSILPVSYYRLKLVDDDNKVSYSRILKVERKNIQTWQVLIQNPVNGILKATFDSKINATGTISIINNLGQVLSKQKYVLKPGQQSYMHQLTHLSMGMYYLVVEFDDVRETKPFVKQ